MPLFIDPTGRTTFGIGICARCSRKFPLEELYSDPNAPGLKVCIDDLDEYDPYRLPARQPDQITLPFTRPDTPLDDIVDPDPQPTLEYLKFTEGYQIRVTEDGKYKELEDAPDGGIPPWDED